MFPRTSQHGPAGGPFIFSFTSTLGQGGLSSTTACPTRDCGRTPGLHSQCRCLNSNTSNSIQCQQKTHVLHWGPAASPTATHFRGKDPSHPACSPFRWLSLATLPGPHPPSSPLPDPQHPTLPALHGPVRLTLPSSVILTPPPNNKQ